MSAEAAVQAALIAALRTDATLAGGLTGLYDGAPARPAFPYLVVGDGLSGDWSTKTARGREHRLAVTIWDTGDGGAEQLLDLLDHAGLAIEAMPRDLPGHRVASLVFLRSRVLRTAAGPWAGMLEYRARTLAV